MRTSLVELPRFRDAPRDVVQNCRRLVPTAELVYIDDGAWYLGSVERTEIRERVGGLKRARAARLWKRMATWALVDAASAARATWLWWEGTLLLQGFAGIEVFRGEPDSRVEEFVRRRHYQWSRNLDAALRRHMAEDDQDARPEDKAATFSPLFSEQKLREAHRWAFRHPKSFTSAYRAEGVA